jgi:hypothetical protein
MELYAIRVRSGVREKTGARAVLYGGERRVVGCSTFPLRIAYPVNARGQLTREPNGRIRVSGGTTGRETLS